MVNDKSSTTSSFKNMFLITILDIIITIYTYITLPIYWLFEYNQDGKSSNKIRAKKINPSDIDSPWIGIQDDDVILKNTIIDSCETLVDFQQKHQEFFPADNPAIGYRHVYYEYFDDQNNDDNNNRRRIKKRQLSDDYEWLSYRQMWIRVEQLARGLCTVGIERGEPVVILCETCAEFLLMQFAISRVGFVQVNVYATLGESGIAHAIRQTNARYVFTSWDLLSKIRSTIVNYELNIQKIIYINRRAQKVSQEILEIEKNYLEPMNSIDFIRFDQLLIKEEEESERRNFFKSLDKDDVSIIVFTSGSTGVPKGVQLTSHQLIKSIQTSLSSVPEIVVNGSNHTFGAFLPQAHIFEAICELTILAFGGRIGFASPFTLVDGAPGLSSNSRSDFSLLRPTVMIVAPLVLKRIQAQIYKKLESKSSFHVTLFNYLINYKLQWCKKGYTTPLINRLVCSKIRAIFGGRIDKIVCGGAPLSPQLQAFCRMAMNTNLVVGFGMTETCGAVLCMDCNDQTYGRCGQPLRNIYVKLMDWNEGGYHRTDFPYPRGELLIGTKTHWNGYLNLDEITKNGYIKDDINGIHYVRTGDIAQIYHDGTIEIIDRKKDLVKLSNGEYVSLGKIETILKNSEYIDHICVFGDRFSNYLVGLIVPNKDKLNSLMMNKGGATTLSIDQLKEIITRLIQKTGLDGGLKPVEIPAQIQLIMDDEWTPDNEMLTAAMKLKRDAIKKRYHNVISEMFKLNNEDGSHST